MKSNVAAPTSSATPAPAEEAAQEAYFARTVVALAKSDADWVAMSLKDRSDLILRAMDREDSPIRWSRDTVKEAARDAAKEAAYLAAMKTGRFAGMTGWRPAALKAYVLDATWGVSEDIAWSAAWDIAAGRDAAWQAARLEGLYKRLFFTVPTFKEYWAGASYNERRLYIFQNACSEQDGRSNFPSTGDSSDMSQVTSI